MDPIVVLDDQEITVSRYVKMRNVKYIQNGVSYSWDYIIVQLYLIFPL